MTMVARLRTLEITDSRKRTQVNMKVTEKRASVMVIMECIEMELFASEESCTVVSVQEHVEDYCSYYRHLEHPLEAETDEDPEPEVQTQAEPQIKLKAVPSITTDHLDDCPLDLTQEREIEMEVFPLSELADKKPGLPATAATFVSAACLNRVTRVKWRRLDQQRPGLVVKDVICLPRGHLLTHPDRHGAPQSKGRAALTAMGMTARITIDYGWTAKQMESRLCLQASRVLFVPDPPAKGWTGEQVLRVCGHGPLYILSHHDDSQAKSYWPASRTQPSFNGEERPLKGSMGRNDEEIRPQDHGFKEDLSLELDLVLGTFRRHAVDRGVRRCVRVSQTEALLSALKTLRRPGFCYTASPVVSFAPARGEADVQEDDGLHEFFSLALLELQQSSVFEGPPDRKFLTYDLKALEERKYHQAGVLIGWSLAHGGPGPQCIHPILYQLMCGQSPSLEDFDWRDITDPEARLQLKRLQSSTNVDPLSQSLCGWVSSCGLPVSYSDDISSIYAHLVKCHIYDRVASMVAQFTEGLNSCGGLWEAVCDHWEAFAVVMTGASVDVDPGSIAA